MIYEHLSESTHNHVFDLAKFKMPRNSNLPDYKPQAGTGLWASPVDEQYTWREYIKDFPNWQIRSSFKFTVSSAANIVTVRDPGAVAELPTRRVLSYEGFDWVDLAQTADAMLVGREVLRQRAFQGYSVPSLIVLNPEIVIPL